MIVAVASETTAVCGSSVSCYAVADVVMDLDAAATADVDAAMITACGSSFCLSSAADAAMDSAAANTPLSSFGLYI